MKIAFASNDNTTISRHFGRAENFVVISFEDGNIIDRKILPKSDDLWPCSQHQGRRRHSSVTGGRGFGRQSGRRLEQTIEDIRDCDILVTRGMGRNVYLDLKQLGLRPILTDIPDIDTALGAIVDDTIIDHPEKLH